MPKTSGIKIYTRTGDKGKTSLIGGMRVPKYSLRVDAYGMVDELNCVVGMLRDHKECKAYKKTLIRIQECLFVLESLTAAGSPEARQGLPALTKNDVGYLEQSIDEMQEGLPPITNFILPGGHIAVSWAHIARTVCRRAERILIELADQEDAPAVANVYINRLSDYFFVLARRLAHDLGAEEIAWITKEKKSRR